jgi:triosephosphate isomerase
MIAMQARRPLVAGNWKMHKTIGEAVGFVREFAALGADLDAVDAVICPPFTALAATRDAIGTMRLGLGAQTMWDLDAGPYTGEISPEMVVDCGATWVILGHSERRASSGETDEDVQRKVGAALRFGLTPIVCVGESASDHAAGRTNQHVVAQARAAFEDIAPADVARCVVGYEPIWAIGSGAADNPKNANAVMGAIRAAVSGLERARLLYGGSVKPENIASFIAQPNIDGALVGTASLDPRSFAALLANANATVAL